MQFLSLSSTETRCMHFFCVMDQLRLTIRIVSSYINVNLLYLIVAHNKSLKIDYSTLNDSHCTGTTENLARGGK